jgi:hypothetical protein
MRKLFIDDLRDPPDDSWIVVRSHKEAIGYFSNHGIPDAISFDHDLGLEETGYDTAKWIVEQVIDKTLDIPLGFVYKVHSMNPVGKQNIESLLVNFTKYYVHNKESI